jgi:adenosine deaminase CECR1
MRNSRLLVEINLISNQLLEYVDDLQKHPFPEYLRFGIPVCLNTDDRGMWDSNMTDEYFTAVRAFQLSWAEVLQLGRASLEFCFAQPEVKAKLLADYDARVAAFETTFAVTYGYAARTWKLSFYPTR